MNFHPFLSVTRLFLSYMLLFGCILMLGGCTSREAVPRTLVGFSQGLLVLDLNAVKAHAILRLITEEESGDCPVLVGSITASMNGSPSMKSFSGAVDVDEGYRSCIAPYFDFSLESLKNTPQAPNGEFVLQDESHNMRLSVGNLEAERKLVRLTSVNELKPGGQMKFAWQPATDSVRDGTYRLLGQGNYFYSSDARVESAVLIADLPVQPWPIGAQLDFSGSALAPILKCEGVHACEPIRVLRSDKVDLPNL